MNNKQKNSKKEKWIYESPDNGTTVFRREMGSSEREKIKG